MDTWLQLVAVFLKAALQFFFSQGQQEKLYFQLSTKPVLWTHREDSNVSQFGIVSFKV